jgi:TRAP-type uncharacterized transport system substrate-binding protein
MENPKDYIWIDATTSWWFRHDPLGPALDYYQGMRFIANANSLTWVVVTYDENIKTPQDLIGKTVDVSREAAANTLDNLWLLDKWGLLEMSPQNTIVEGSAKVELTYTGTGGGVALLQDGLVDATMIFVDHIYPGGFYKGSYIERLETKAPVYYWLNMGDTQKDLLASLDLFETEKTSMAGPIRIRPGALGSTQSEEVWAWANPLYFAADETMDEDIVYEVARVIWESAGEWDIWHPQGAHMTPEFIPATPFAPADAHPGALKFYGDNGIEVKNIISLIGA